MERPDLSTAETVVERKRRTDQRPVEGIRRQAARRLRIVKNNGTLCRLRT
jgi:hypothetical protein